MKILVCVKQVPRLDQVRFQPVINRIVREGIESTTNPLDLAALGHALALRDGAGGEVVVVTMGPPGARESLVDALRRGADRAVHLVDMTFAGADTLATARALRMVIERERPDLVLLGRSTMDGATAQVAPQLAEFAGLAQVTHATAISLDGGGLRVARATEEGTDSWLCDTPVVVSVEDGPQTTAGDATPADAAIEELDAQSIGGDSAGYGIRGSATYVQKVIDLPGKRLGERIVDATELARRVDTLATSPPATGEDGRTAPGGARELWVVAEPYRDALHPISVEGIAAAGAVAARLDASVVAVLLCAEPGDSATELARAGADRVLVARDPALAQYRPEPYTSSLAALVRQRAPFAVIGPWTTRGRDFLPRVAGRLGLGMTGDVVGLDVDSNPGDPSSLDLVWLKPAWAGTVLARVVARTVPSMGTLRPGSVPARAASPGRHVPIETVPAEVSDDHRASLVSTAAEGACGLLDACAVLLLLGVRASAEDAAAAVRLADDRGWSVAGTQAAVAAGQLPPAREVSLRKRSLSPRLVLGIGLDAADLDAVRGASTVITVDPDPAAAVHGNADVAAIVDHTEALSAIARCDALGRLGVGESS